MEKPRSSILIFFLKRYKLQFAVVTVMSLFVSILESVSIGAFFPVFVVLVGDSDEQVGGILGSITRLVSILPFAEPIVSASIFLVGIFVVKGVSQLCRDRYVACASADILYETKKEILDSYAAAEYQFFLDNNQGSLIYNSINAPTALANLMIVGAGLLSHLLKALAIFAVLLLVMPYAALAIAAIGIAFYASMHYLSSRVSYVLGQRKTLASTNQFIIGNEFLSGIHQLITLRALGTWIARFDKENKEFSDAHALDMIWTAVPRPLMEVLGVALISGLIMVLWFTNSSNFADVLPKLGVFAIALVQLLPAITAFGRGRMGIMSRLPDVERVYHKLAGPSESRQDGFRDLESFKHALKFENVSFSHKGRDLLLAGVDLTIEKGKVTAIVGGSGAGKTTIINLILGLFQPTGGKITVDGIPLQEIKRDSWLSKVGFVSQEPFTYHSTVANNISLGGTGHSTESIVESAHIANAHEFISAMPDGYESITGERGMKLSGGQQQRIAIARAVLDNPEILMFDEATSSLDTLSEKIVQDAIISVSADRTVIIVAHRLSTVRHADKIIVIDNGRIVEQGTHQELLSKNGEYAQMVALTR
ncbi:ABC transporter ATP-binding protein [SAR202 cluster bacterium AD-802-F09_MRT_200m]|nr:ABC transporter ATP-binding protein [SAR202 cluster bacterium AD-802-F09_MRT_200m]